jgi:hypothetical protein
LNKGYGTNGGGIGEYLGCTFLGACCTTSLMEEIFHFELFSSPFLAEAFTRVWVLL